MNLSYVGCFLEFKYVVIISCKTNATFVMLNDPSSSLVCLFPNIVNLNCSEFASEDDGNIYSYSVFLPEVFYTVIQYSPNHIYPEISFTDFSVIYHLLSGFNILLFFKPWSQSEKTWNGCNPMHSYFWLNPLITLGLDWSYSLLDYTVALNQVILDKIPIPTILKTRCTVLHIWLNASLGLVTYHIPECLHPKSVGTSWYVLILVLSLMLWVKAFTCFL